MQTGKQSHLRDKSCHQKSFKGHKEMNKSAGCVFIEAVWNIAGLLRCISHPSCRFTQGLNKLNSF